MKTRLRHTPIWHYEVVSPVNGASYSGYMVGTDQMLDQGTPASVKVRAAECVMAHSSKAIEIEDIDARVAELERAGGTQKQ